MRWLTPVLLLEKQAANAAGVPYTRWLPLMKIWKTSGIAQFMVDYLGLGISFVCE